MLPAASTTEPQPWEGRGDTQPPTPPGPTSPGMESPFRFWLRIPSRLLRAAQAQMCVAPPLRSAQAGNTSTHNFAVSPCGGWSCSLRQEKPLTLSRSPLERFQNTPVALPSSFFLVFFLQGERRRGKEQGVNLDN